jgi:hypothetical protein
MAQVQNNKRTLRDANLSVSHALPAAAASNNTSAIDTAQDNSGRIDFPGVELLIELPATPSLVDAKTVTLTLKDSADNSSFSAVADVPAQVVTGGGGVGGAALAYQFKLPIGLRRYLRLDAAVLTAGGDNTAISYALSFVF